MKNLLIGSRALNYWYPEVPIKDTTDWDVISDTPIEGTEWHDPKLLKNYSMERYATGAVVNGFNVVALKGLFIIKRSHLWRDLSFGKHIAHFHKYLNSHRGELDKGDWVVYKERLLATQVEFPRKHPRLNVSVIEFFDDYVTKKYDHDYLHELLAYEDKPMYSRLQRDTTKAWCEKDLWDSLTQLQKVQCVAEETQVIAVERFMVPNNWGYIPRLAYMKSLEKVCTTLTSGWFRDFAIDNYPSIVLQFDAQRILGIKSKLKE